MPRILIAEDAKVDRAVVVSLLEKQDDLQVESVANGVEALRAIETQVPDLVVTDLMMPMMDGLELVRTIRDRFPLLPVIIMTSKGSEETAVRALEQGAASYVPKRQLAQLLPDTIETVLAAAVQRRGRAHLMKVVLESRSTFVLENDRRLFRPLIQFLQDTMAEFGLFDDQECMRVGVAIEEGLNNAAEHGNLELDSALREDDMAQYVQLMRDRCEDEKFRARRIHFEAMFTPAEAVFDIRDEGPGFDPATVPDPSADANLESASGRGMMLMRMFMDDVEYNDTGNRVRLTKRRSTAPIA